MKDPVNEWIGRRIGSRVLVGPIGSEITVNKELQWRWKCESCGRTGISSFRSILNSSTCGSTKCLPRREHLFTQTVPRYHPGDRIGVWEIVKDIPPQKKTRNGRWYQIRCTRCGALSAQAQTRIRNNSKYCMKCWNKYEICGQLLSYPEIETLFGVKRALIMVRRRQGMSLEQAIFKPVETFRDPYKRRRNETHTDIQIR